VPAEPKSEPVKALLSVVYVNCRSFEKSVGFLADIAPREQSRADINVDFGTGLTGTWNSEDKLGVLANDFSKLLQFTYTTDSKAFRQARSSAPQALGRTAPSTLTTETPPFPARP